MFDKRHALVRFENYIYFLPPTSYFLPYLNRSYSTMSVSPNPAGMGSSSRKRKFSSRSTGRKAA